MPSSTRLPRPAGVRVLIAGLVDLGAYGTVVGLAMLAGGLAGSWHLVFFGTYAVFGPVVVWLAPTVSYRRRDALLAPWVFGIVVWRMASLPYRDWPPRDDEVRRARYLRAEEFGDRRDAEFAGLWCLQPAGGEVSADPTLAR